MKRVSMLALALSCGMWVVSQAAWSQSSGSSGSQSGGSPQSQQSQSGGSAPSGGSQPSAKPDNQSGSQTSGGYGQSSSDQSQNKIEGCLMGSAGNYTLTDSKTGATYQLGGDTSKLSQYVGQSVQVKGSKGSDSSGGASGTTSSASGTSSGAGGGQTFNVTSVKKGSGSCGASK